MLFRYTMPAALAASLCIIAAYAQSIPGYPVNTICVRTNAARANLAGYNATYGNSGGIIACRYGVSLPPYYLASTLLAASKFFADDLAVNGYGGSRRGSDPHNSVNCVSDGCSASDRVNQFYKSKDFGENIAHGQLTPRDVMNDWIASSEHCPHIVSGEYGEMGAGYNSAMWVQDFGGRKPFYDGRVITCGAHDFPANNVVEFMMATYSSSTPAYYARVVVNDNPVNMTYQFGTSIRNGMATVTLEINPAECSTYYFEVFGPDRTVYDRYPGTGDMYTNGRGCSSLNRGVDGNWGHTYADPFAPKPPPQPALVKAPVTTQPAPVAAVAAPPKTTTTTTGSTTADAAQTSALKPSPDSGSAKTDAFMSGGKVGGNPVINGDGSFGEQSAFTSDKPKMTQPWEVITLVFGLLGLALVIGFVVRIVQLNKKEDKPWYKPRPAGALVDMEKIQAMLDQDRLWGFKAGGGSKAIEQSAAQNPSLRVNSQEVPEIDVIIDKSLPPKPHRPVTLTATEHAEAAWKSFAALVTRKK